MLNPIQKRTSDQYVRSKILRRFLSFEHRTTKYLQRDIIPNVRAFRALKYDVAFIVGKLVRLVTSQTRNRGRDHDKGILFPSMLIPTARCIFKFFLRSAKFLRCFSSRSSFLDLEGFEIGRSLSSSFEGTFHRGLIT